MSIMLQVFNSLPSLDQPPHNVLSAMRYVFSVTLTSFESLPHSHSPSPNILYMDIYIFIINSKHFWQSLYVCVCVLFDYICSHVFASLLGLLGLG